MVSDVSCAACNHSVEKLVDAMVSLGDIVYLDAVGQPMIILGTHEAAIDLLDKRAANYSDRKLSSMAEL